MKLIVDMNLAPRWVETLAAAGFEAVHWSSTGSPFALDEEIMSWAAAERCVVLTNDLDFGAMLAASRGTKPSVVQIRSDDLSPDVIGSKVVAALTQLTAELSLGALGTIDPVRTRLRLLPIHSRD